MMPRLARPVLVFLLLNLTGCASAPLGSARLGEPDDITTSRIRHNASRDILRRPVEIKRPTDVALAEKIFARTPVYQTVSPPQFETITLPDIQVLTAPTSLKMALTAISRAIGYLPPVFTPDAPNPSVTVSAYSTSLDVVLSSIERQAGVIINLFPHAKTIFVAPHNATTMGSVK
jgi:hypothetical protein